MGSCWAAQEPSLVICDELEEQHGDGREGTREGTYV